MATVWCPALPSVSSTSLWQHLTLAMMRPVSFL
jgi:hypothetical protein